MKNLLILLFCSLLMCACDKNDDQFDKSEPTILEKNSFSEGIYMGYFVFHEISYWCEIEFRSGKYEEWPSGGVWYQKEISCLTTGTYNIDTYILSFDLESYKFPPSQVQCASEMILPGKYKIHLISNNDSLIFSNGVGQDKIKYHLERILK